MNQLVGGSEANVRAVIKTMEAIAPAILWIDEIEKGLSGTTSSGQTDGGTTARVFSTLLTWMAEKTKPIFIIATANNISQLPPELLRPGRFDSVFFVDLPNRAERQEIFAIHLEKKGRDISKFDLNILADSTEGYSGAEIEQIVKDAIKKVWAEAQGERDIGTSDLLEAARKLVPLSRTMRGEIDRMQQWAKDRAQFASSPEEGVDEELASGKARVRLFK